MGEAHPGPRSWFGAALLVWGCAPGLELSPAYPDGFLPTGDSSSSLSKGRRAVAGPPRTDNIYNSITSPLLGTASETGG